MRIVKSTISACLSAVIIAQSFSFPTATGDSSPFDEMSRIQIGDLTYTYLPDQPRKGECTLVGVSDSDDIFTISHHDTLDIPEKLDGLTLTALGYEEGGIAYNIDREEIKLTTIKLPHTIREIHGSALSKYSMKWVDTLYIDFTNLEEVGMFAFGLTTNIEEVYVYDPIDGTYYPTSNDIDKFRELVSIEGVRFEPVYGDRDKYEIAKQDCYQIAKSEYEKDPTLNVRLRFIDEIGKSPYLYDVAMNYAKEVVRKYDLDSPELNDLQKMEKIQKRQ